MLLKKERHGSKEEIYCHESLQECNFLRHPSTVFGMEHTINRTWREYCHPNLSNPAYHPLHFRFEVKGCRSKPKQPTHPFVKGTSKFNLPNMDQPTNSICCSPEMCRRHGDVEDPLFTGIHVGSHPFCPCFQC